MGFEDKCRAQAAKLRRLLIVTCMQAPLQTGNTFGKNPLHITLPGAGGHDRLH
jgi:hypothetical protein